MTFPALIVQLREMRHAGKPAPSAVRPETNYSLPWRNARLKGASEP